MNPFAQALSAALEYTVVSHEVSKDGYAVGFLYREAAEFEHDSGWRLFSGGESDEYCDNAGHFDIVSIQDICSNHPELKALLQQKPDSGAWAWDETSEQYLPLDDWQNHN